MQDNVLNQEVEGLFIKQAVHPVPIPHQEGFTKKSGFPCKNAQRCLSNGANLERPSEICTFCLEEIPHAGLLLSPFRFSNSTKGVHETQETSRRGTPAERDSTNYIFRQHIENDRILQSSSSTCSI